MDKSLNQKSSTPNYPRNRSAKLICACYNQNGADIRSEFLEHSALEDSLGNLPDTWNVGLFRFLDESIYLMKYLSYFAFGQLLRDKSERSLSILTHQVEKNLLAVRVLCTSGLDASARQNLRATLEMCQALCRCVVDHDFCKSFSAATTPETANKFWHEFIAKDRTTKFLKRYNDTNEDKCFLVEDDLLGETQKVLGVAAHPNFLGWSFDFENDWTNVATENQNDKMFQFGPSMASELVLTTATKVAFMTIQFYAKKISSSQSTLGLLDKNPMFTHCGSEREVFEAMSQNSTLMFLMLCKLVNREKPDFDANMHF